MDKDLIFKTMLEEGMAYQAYLELTDNLLHQNKTTGPVQSEELTEYTHLNRTRMKRIDKTFQLIPELEATLSQLQKPLLWGVLSEAWCGDAAQSVPVLAAVAAATPYIQFSILLRDEHPEIMDNYLTNGGRSIPKMVCFDERTKEELFTWGPRPEEAQKMVLQLKNDPEISKDEFIKQIQLWYARDRTRSIQLELSDLLRRVL